tara:strand:- start:7054 stop:7350 length:297 start_codon:yes stop_codon:yes gene_type:complete
MSLAINSSPIKSNIIINSEISDNEKYLLLIEDKDLLLENLRKKLVILNKKKECIHSAKTYEDIEKCIFSFRKSNRLIRQEIGEKRSNLYDLFKIKKKN